MTTQKLQAGGVFPLLSLPKVGGGTLNLGTAADGYDWQMIVVYRGKHCPICTRYLSDLNAVLPDLNGMGIDVVAVSADPENLALEQLADVHPKFAVGYDLSIAQMQAMGLYITAPNSRMPVVRHFAEPAVIVTDETGHVKMIDISNVPFMRPSLDSLTRGLRFVRSQTEPFPVTGSFAG